MCVALLVVASRIILPIIWAEGLRAVFLPQLAPKPLSNVKRVESLRSLGGSTGVLSRDPSFANFGLVMCQAGSTTSS
jgi:hypothetical protein